MARTGKKENDVLSLPDLKPGKTLDKTAVPNVVSFYNSENVSRLMPGMRDFVTVGDGKEQIGLIKLQKG